jgi:hypothetical protein
MRLRITFRRALGFVLVLAALASVTATASNMPQRLKADGPRGHATVALSQLRTAGKVTVRIAGRSNNGHEVEDGGVAGRGHFTASGAISDKGTETTYRTRKAALITLRFVTVGKKGKITFVVKIDTNVGSSRWTIASGTKAYKGLHGKGIERENADYTVSTLTGTVWR